MLCPPITLLLGSLLVAPLGMCGHLPYPVLGSHHLRTIMDTAQDNMMGMVDKSAMIGQGEAYDVKETPG